MLVESGAGPKALGRRAIAQKLYQRGIHRDTAQTALEAVGSETERENALLWARRLAPKAARRSRSSAGQSCPAGSRARVLAWDAILYALRSVEGNQKFMEKAGTCPMEIRQGGRSDAAAEPGGIPPPGSF